MNPITSKACMYESHMHTVLCKHAQGTLDEYAAVAIERNLKGITVTCHCPLPAGIDADSRMAYDQIESYVEMVMATRTRFLGRLDVRLGLESDYLPRLVPWLKRIHSEQCFSYILGSVHPQAAYYRDSFWTGNMPDYCRLYYNHLAEAAETGLFDCLSHPDLVKIVEPQNWDFGAVKGDIARSLDRIALTGISMEYNTAGLSMKKRIISPSLAQLRMMRERDIKVVIGGDAHNPLQVGEHFHQALDLLQKAGYTHVALYLDRKRQDLEIDLVRSSLPVPVMAA